MRLEISGHSYVVDGADTLAARELKELLPLKIAMNDHRGNEKYAVLPRSLSASDIAIGNIQAGDIMLWQGDTLVVFYESFSTPYRYTPLGKIRDAQSLKAAVGGGSVDVTFTF